MDLFWPQEKLGNIHRQGTTSETLGHLTGRLPANWLCCFQEQIKPLEARLPGRDVSEPLACSCSPTRLCQNEEHLFSVFPFDREQNILSSHRAELENATDKGRRPSTTRPPAACIYSTPRTINCCVTGVLWHVPSASERTLVQVLHGVLVWSNRTRSHITLK